MRSPKACLATNGGNLEQTLADRISSGWISTDDADEVRTFAAFLRDAGHAPEHPGFDRERARAGMGEHYPDVLAEIDADDTREQTP